MKKSWSRAVVYLLSILALSSCGQTGVSSSKDTSSTPLSSPTSTSSDASSSVSSSASSRNDAKLASTLYVNKVENMPDDFILGMDASSVIAEEESGVKYYDYDGKEADVFKVLSESGVNTIRVRIWNNPYNSAGKGYGGGNNDLAKAIAIGKRATAYQMKLLLDFHYSDFWADPSKQQCPKAWAAMDYTEKSEALYAYTKDCLTQLVNAGVAIRMVQLGNETTGGKMAGETRFSFYAGLVNSGAKAVREVCPDALIAVHFTNPEKTGNYADYAAKLATYNVDYDVFGSSYYPYWHGTLENLSSVLNDIATTYKKKVMILETSYAYTTEDTDFWSNTIGATSGYDKKDYPFTIAGQTNSVREITNCVVNSMSNGIGICYWEGTWISVGQNSLDENKVKWEKYGSGWAASYASEYDAKDAGQYYGGCAVDNQAFFDAKGKPLESLKVFNLMRYGNVVDKYIDGIEDVSISHYTYETFSLPESVNVIYNDNSKAAIPVTWESFDIEAAKAKGNGKYDIAGTAGGQAVVCHLTILEKNFLSNYGFEDGVLTPWTLTLNGASASDNYVAKVTKENPQTGSYNFNFWAKDADTMNFDLEQAVSLSASGTYKFQASTMGGGNGTDADTAKENFYLYVKINGTEVGRTSTKVTSYGTWYDAIVKDIAYTAGDTLSVGLHIESPQAGIWGSIDDCMLNIVG